MYEFRDVTTKNLSYMWQLNTWLHFKSKNKTVQLDKIAKIARPARFIYIFIVPEFPLTDSTFSVYLKSNADYVQFRQSLVAFTRQCLFAWMLLAEMLCQ